jgi:hypothetical protein
MSSYWIRVAHTIDGYLYLKRGTEKYIGKKPCEEAMEAEVGVTLDQGMPTEIKKGAKEESFLQQSE